jgi:hypothetical protein
MGKIFDTSTSSVELTFRKSNQLGHLVDLADSEGFQNLPQNAALDQYKTWLDCVSSVNQKLYLFFQQPALYDGITEFLHLLLCCICKTSCKSVVENMGSIVDRRACGSSVSSNTLCNELVIWWQGPLVTSKRPWMFTLVHRRSGIYFA